MAKVKSNWIDEAKEVNLEVRREEVKKLSHLEELEALHAKLIELAVFDRSNLEVLIAKARAAL